MVPMTSQALTPEYGSADEYVGERVNQLLWRNKMTKRDLGSVLGLEGQSIGRKMRGERTWTLDELLLVARHFGVPLSDLVPPAEYEPVLQGRGRSVPGGGTLFVARDEVVPQVGVEPTTIDLLTRERVA